jgi:hypothetical protein
MCRIVTKLSKVEILYNMWDKLIGVIQLQATARDCPVIKELAKNLILIPKEVQREALVYYLKQCQELYGIAFFQWRLLYKG